MSFHMESDFCIMLDNPHKQYHPNEIVSGIIVIRVPVDTPYYGVQINLFSESYVLGPSQRPYGLFHPVEMNYHLVGTEEYWRNRYYRTMPVRRGYRRELFRRIDPVYRHWVVRYLRFLKKGITIIPFKVPMPSEQPSTFKGTNGVVRYYLEAHLKNRHFMFHRCHHDVFYVNPILEPVDDDPLNLPLYCEATRRLRKWYSCIDKGTVTMRLGVERGSCLVGDSIRFSACVENDTFEAIESSKVSLVERIEYFRGGRLYKSYDYSLATLERNEIQPDDVEVWNNEEIIVPYFHPQNTAYCRNIVASYHLMLEANLSNSKSYRLEVPMHLASYAIPEVEFDYPAMNMPLSSWFRTSLD